MFGWDFEVNAKLRFWNWNLIKICVWAYDMNSTLGSVVPLAMLYLFIPPPSVTESVVVVGSPSTTNSLEYLRQNCSPTTFHDIAVEDKKYIMCWYFRPPIPKTRCSYWWVIDWGSLVEFTSLVKVQGRDIPSGASWKYIMHRMPWILQSLPIQYKIRRHPLTNQVNRLCK